MQSILYYLKKYFKEILLYALLLVSLGMQMFVLINYENKDNVISDNLAYTNLDDTQTKEVVKEEKEILTDASKIYIMKGEKVYLVNGEVSNIKITYPYDLRVAETLVNNMEGEGL